MEIKFHDDWLMLVIHPITSVFEVVHVSLSLTWIDTLPIHVKSNATLAGGYVAESVKIPSLLIFLPSFML